MKKITLLALLLGGALCASAVTPISKTVKTLPKSRTEIASTRANGLVPQAIEVQHMRGAKAISEATTWDFEDAEQFAQFTIVDSDGDGFNWEYYNMTGVETGRMTPHSGEGLISSKSYDNDGAGALTPDNWLISPEVTLGGAVKFFAAGQDANYASEVFGVFVCVGDPSNLANFVQVGSNCTATGEYVEYEFDLNAYAGQTGYFAIRHYNVTDMFMLNVDDLTFDPNAVAMNDPGVPTNIVVEPGSTDAVVSWTLGSDNVTNNLRYREYVNIAETNRFIDLPYDEEIYPAQLEGVYIYDADSDGNNWGLAVNPKNENDLCFTSASYSGGALSPDNWLIFPAKLGGSLKFTAMNYSSSYPDNLGVFVATGEDLEAVIAAGAEALTQVNEDFEPVYNEWTEYSFDLSSYEGMGYIIIRHYNCTDQWRLYVDDIDITVPDPKEIPDWTEVEDVDNPFTIDELTPETTYEVQVQGVNRVRAEGDKVSAWSESVIFTTLPAGQEDAVYYVVGGFNGWAEEEGIEIGEEGATIIVEAQGENDTNQEFKLITPDVADGEGWIWLGGADENGVNYFAITEELLGGEISLETPGANFRLPEAGTYTIKLVMVPLKAQVEGLKMIVTKEDITAIDTVKSEVKGDNNYYNLMGQKMNGNNLPAGIYIHNGKKVVVK